MTAAPQETFLLDSYAFHWREEGVEILIDRLHEDKEGLRCEMSISTSRVPVQGLLREGRFNLSSAPTRAGWVKELTNRMPPEHFGFDWYAAMELVCARSIRRWRQGEPLVDLASVEVSEELPYLLYPLMVDGAASVLFADGGSGKSLLMLACAVSVATGEEIIPGIRPLRAGPVIYWDWEWDQESHAERLQAICAGAGIAVPQGLVYYQREMTSVMEAIPRMRKRVAEVGAVGVFADSIGFARGGDANSQDLTTQMFAAWRTLVVPVLASDHIDKASKREGAAADSFGSIYTRNSARTMWRLDAQKEEGNNLFYAALVNTKANRKTQKPIGLSVHMTVDDDERLLSVQFASTDIREMPGMSKTLSLRDQIELVIRANAGQHITPSEIVSCLEAEGVSASEHVVRTVLSRAKRQFIKVERGWELAVHG